jgi:hypothetical protein
VFKGFGKNHNCDCQGWENGGAVLGVHAFILDIETYSTQLISPSSEYLSIGSVLKIEALFRPSVF